MYVVRIDASRRNRCAARALWISSCALRAAAIQPRIAYADEPFWKQRHARRSHDRLRRVRRFRAVKSRATPLLAPDGTRLYVADPERNAISVVDTIPSHRRQRPSRQRSTAAIALTPDGKTLWVANGDDGTIAAIDTAALARDRQRCRRPRTARNRDRVPTARCSTSATAARTPSRRSTSRRADRASAIAVGERPCGHRGDARRQAALRRRTAPATTSCRSISPGRQGVRADSRRRRSRGDRDLTRRDARVRYQLRQLDVTPIDLRTGTAHAAPIEVGGAPVRCLAFTRDGRIAVVVVRATTLRR